MDLLVVFMGHCSNAHPVAQDLMPHIFVLVPRMICALFCVLSQRVPCDDADAPCCVPFSPAKLAKRKRFADPRPPCMLL